MSKKRLLIAVAALLVVAAVVSAVVTGVRYWGMKAEENARDSALSAATEYTETMFARDPKTVADNINKSMSFLTGNAKDEFQRNVSEFDIAKKVKEDKIVSAVTIQGAGVMSNTRDTAKVLVYMNLSTTRNTVEDVQIDPSRLVYDMVRRDGTWMISAIDILDDESLRSRVQKSDTTPSGAVPIPSSEPSAPASPAPTS
ncbi:MAG: hypothetical protein LBE07_06395 [Gordonia sp. (in: high G+C Gram-positive bacteria)]|jgi:Mce-associated membrane protein|nr:hypothetical protein [Gordonia sp. (in: high G+C Gram-positive bacteria)]